MHLQIWFLTIRNFVWRHLRGISPTKNLLMLNSLVHFSTLHQGYFMGKRELRKCLGIELNTPIDKRYVMRISQTKYT